MEPILREKRGSRLCKRENSKSESGGYSFPFPLGYMEETRPWDLCTETGRWLLREPFLLEDKELWG